MSAQFTSHDVRRLAAARGWKKTNKHHQKAVWQHPAHGTLTHTTTDGKSPHAWKLVRPDGTEKGYKRMVDAILEHE